MDRKKVDILVIGSGAAGLFFAIKAARYAKVLVVTKKDAFLSNTNYAQGGIASVTSPADSFTIHTQDTIDAGRGLCDRKAVEVMVREGPQRIDELISMGVRFNREDDGGDLALGREGGHSRSRIIHYGDMTGKELESALVRACDEDPGITLEENWIATDLVTDGRGRVCGCHLFKRTTREMVACAAGHTVLATGGAGKIYLYTSNPDVATGDGIAMAYNAGAEIANLEFVQFHPTCLYHPDAKGLLISEALRGEGAVLKDCSGRKFMKQYDPRAELAPRDIVARAIDSEMKKSGDKYVLLDISHREAGWLRSRFPYVNERCLEFGIDISKDPIPVVPAAHYMVGGVKTDIDGRTNLRGLSAIGEVACSGVHGANRLASNSLLEAIVMAHRCAERLQKELEPLDRICSSKAYAPVEKEGGGIETVILDHDWDLARRVMWDYVGIVRSDERLGIARKRIRQVQETAERLYRDHALSADLIELRNIAIVSSLVIESAKSRKESRGLHFNADHPETDPAWERDTIIKRSEE